MREVVSVRRRTALTTTVFVFEFLTGGGWLTVEANPPSGSLLAEGAAMLTAIAADFSALPDVKVALLHDRRLTKPNVAGCDSYAVTTPDELQSGLANLAADSDFALVIAPELDGHLAKICGHVLASGGRLLSPDLPLVEVASDKHETCRRLAAAGLRVPSGVAREPGECLSNEIPLPIVVKPRNGAGSQDVRLITTSEQFRCFPAVKEPTRQEAFHGGTAVSAALLCGPDWSTYSLPPCRQYLSQDGQFRYLGGETPLPSDLAHRAVNLARDCILALPPATGYVGVDMVLGPAASGEQDVVVEVNPRLTTSYVGLRAACRNNLAHAMLNVAQGKPAELSFRPMRVKFSPDGNITKTR